MVPLHFANLSSAKTCTCYRFSYSRLFVVLSLLTDVIGCLLLAGRGLFLRTANRFVANWCAANLLYEGESWDRRNNRFFCRKHLSGRPHLHIQRWDSGEQPFYGQDRIQLYRDNQARNWEPWDGHRHRFDAGREFRPPEGNAWGWQDPNRFSLGWDQWFFQQDPNYENWQPTMNQESQAVTSLLDNGNTKSAADALNTDLWQMKGDVYAQNQLLSQVRDTQSGAGASLYLGQWNPDRGTWDQIEVVSPKPEPGYVPDQSYMLQTFE